MSEMQNTSSDASQTKTHIDSLESSYPGRDNREMHEVRDQLQDQHANDVGGNYPPEATEEDMFFADLGDEQIKKTLPFFNETLGRLLTLGTAMVAVSVALLKDDILINSFFKKAALIAFLVGAACALFGIIPYEADIIRRSPTSVKRSFDKATNKKKLATGMSGGCLLFGLLFLILGVLFK